MAAIYTSNVQFGSRVGDIIGLSNCYLGEPWTQKSTGAITVTASGGVTVSGLTIGQFYCIEARGGPWALNAEFTYQFTFGLSNDGGNTWSFAMGWSGASDVFALNLPAWGIRLEKADNLRARAFWKATTTSIKIRVADTIFGDNGV